MALRPVKPRRSVKPAAGQREVVASALATSDPASANEQPTTDEQQRILMEAKQQRLQLLASTLVKYRKEAIEGRVSSGIEEIWREDEEHYEGIDERNKGTSADTTKPPGTVAADEGDECIEFLNITRPYVDAAAAKVGDILLPTDDRAWSLKETPIPELIERAKNGGLTPEVIDGLAQIGASEETAVQVAQAEQQAAAAVIEEAKAKAKRAEKRIEDWHIEGQYHAEMRKVIDSACKLGTGVLKGPMPVVKRQQMYRDGKLIIEEVKKPVSKAIDLDNCFPDPSCGQNIHAGRFHCERDHITSKQLEMLKMDPDYIGDQIDACLREGPTVKVQAPRHTADGRTLDDSKIFEIWYLYVYVSREDLEAADCKCKGEGSVPAVFTLVNDRVVKGALNHLDTGEFPYDYFPWQRRKNMPWGAGVARQIRTPQRMVVAANRVMLTNAGRAAGPLVIMKNNVKGSNGRNDIVPWKIYYADKDDPDVRNAFAVIEIPDRRESLMAIVQLGMKMAEDVTGLPLLLQGQAGAAPDTLGGQQLVDRNASGVLRRIARTIDDTITEPHIRRYYTYLLLYGDDDFEKGEFVIDARGSTALVDREIDKQMAQALLQACLEPRFKLDPAKTMNEYLRANNRDPKAFQYTDEEWKKIQEQQAQAQQQGDPKAQASLQVAEVRGKADIQKANLTARSDMNELRFKASEAAKDRAHDRQMKEMERDIRMMELAQEQGLSIAEIKSQLAQTTMKLTTQARLSKEKVTGPQVATPPTEPAGRAKPGQAYQA